MQQQVQSAAAKRSSNALTESTNIPQSTTQPMQATASNLSLLHPGKQQLLVDDQANMLPQQQQHQQQPPHAIQPADPNASNQETDPQIELASNTNYTPVPPEQVNPSVQPAATSHLTPGKQQTCMAPPAAAVAATPLCARRTTPSSQSQPVASTPIATPAAATPGAMTPAANTPAAVNIPATATPGVTPGPGTQPKASKQTPELLLLSPEQKQSLKAVYEDELPLLQQELCKRAPLMHVMAEVLAEPGKKVMPMGLRPAVSAVCMLGI